jgi:hypothetical protein
LHRVVERPHGLATTLATHKELLFFRHDVLLFLADTKPAVACARRALSYRESLGYPCSTQPTSLYCE